MPIVVPLFYVLAGIGIYATYLHLFFGLGQPQNRVHLLFSAMVSLTVPYVIGMTLEIQAKDLATFVLGNKSAFSAGATFFLLFPWFIGAFSGCKPRGLRPALSGLFALLLFIGLFKPHGVQYAELHELRFLSLPWGETLTLGVGQLSRWSSVFYAAMAICLGYALWALFRHYRTEGEGLSLAMILATLVFLCSVLLSWLIRLGVVEFIGVSGFGFIAMMILMSLTLTHQTEQRLRASEQRFRSLVNQAPFGIQVLDAGGRTQQTNATFAQLHRGNARSISAMNLSPHVHRALAGHASETPAFCLGKHWVRSYIYPVREYSQQVTGVVITYQDVTEAQRIQEAIRRIGLGVKASTGEGFFQQLMVHLANLLDADYAFVGVPDEHNPTTINTVAVWSHDNSISSLSYSLAVSPCINVMAGTTCVYPAGVQQHFPEDQDLVDLGIESYLGTPLLGSQGALLGLMVVLSRRPLNNIDEAREIIEIFSARAGAELERLQTEQHIRRMAYVDYLTGLASRAHLHQHLAEVLPRLQVGNQYDALLLIDLDHFKIVNDVLSHATGDEVLKVVARRLQAVAGAAAFVARFGGDEFIVVMGAQAPNAQAIACQARALGERILGIFQQALQVGERSFNLGASIGVVIMPGYGRTEAQVLQHADMAVHQAKQWRRGTVQFYSADMQQSAAQRLQLEEGLRRALSQQQELSLHYQPQVNARGQTVGVEVLLRWQHPDLGNISPELFIPVAEETGLIHELGGWVLDRACAQLSIWKQQGLPCGQLSVNVSPWQFVHGDFLQRVQGTLQAHQISPGELCLEITESALLNDVGETIEKLKALRMLGVDIALDDFGTGYASFANLRDLPLDYLKIDKSFVRELSSGAEHSLVEAIVTLGHNLGLRVIAEGVELDTEYAMLMHLGCEFFQGYLFSRPMPEAELLAWLQSPGGRTP